MWRRLIFNANGPKGKKKMCFFFVLLIFQSKLKVHLFFPKGKNLYVKNEIKELQIVLL